MWWKAPRGCPRNYSWTQIPENIHNNNYKMAPTKDELDIETESDQKVSQRIKLTDP